MPIIQINIDIKNVNNNNKTNQTNKYDKKTGVSENNNSKNSDSENDQIRNKKRNVNRYYYEHNAGKKLLQNMLIGL